MSTPTTTISPTTTTTPTVNSKNDNSTNMFGNLFSILGNMLNPKTIIDFTASLMPTKLIESIKLMGTSFYHLTMLIVFILIAYLLYHLLQKQILSMMGIFIMMCIIGLFYIRFSYNSQVKINKYSILFNKLCVKYKNDPLCKQYLKLLNENNNVNK